MKINEKICFKTCLTYQGNPVYIGETLDPWDERFFPDNCNWIAEKGIEVWGEERVEAFALQYVSKLSETFNIWLDYKTELAKRKLSNFICNYRT